jgi:hypothetical protein
MQKIAPESKQSLEKTYRSEIATGQTYSLECQGNDWDLLEQRDQGLKIQMGAERGGSSAESWIKWSDGGDKTENDNKTAIDSGLWKRLQNELLIESEWAVCA